MAQRSQRRKSQYAAEISGMKGDIAPQLRQLVRTLRLLANGGLEQVEEEYLPAGLVFIDDTSPFGTSQRRPIKVLAYPDKDPEELVLVRRKRSVTLPDRASLIYLIDRVSGRPDVTISDGAGAEEQPPQNATIDELHQAYADLKLSGDETLSA